MVGSRLVVQAPQWQAEGMADGPIDTLLDTAEAQPDCTMCVVAVSREDPHFSDIVRAFLYCGFTLRSSKVALRRLLAVSTAKAGDAVVALVYSMDEDDELTSDGSETDTEVDSQDGSDFSDDFDDA
mmetsp:Transcript_50394/g.110226  ORF Transcript_50394/g.110226 Transcript_50394/m.110226 type:complete len:126 (+) Transcript_50394:344-721(+)